MHDSKFITTICVVFLFVAIFFLSIIQAAELSFYVSPNGNDGWGGESVDKPFATIQRAQETIRALKKRGDLNDPVTVYLLGGMYELTEPVIFKVEDSGTQSAPITYTAYKKEKPVISGGRKIAGPWKSYKGNILVCTIDEVKNGDWKFNQLFAGGKRLPRAHIPNDKYYRIEQTDDDMDNMSFKFKEGHIKKWSNLNDVEVILFHSRNESRLHIASINEERNIVTFTGQIGRKLGRKHTLNRYFIENVLEGLDQPGEWYLDYCTGNLYYMPHDGNRDPEVRAPVINQLVRFSGNRRADQYVEYITLQGLTFAAAGWSMPEDGISTIKDVGDIWFPSAITLDGTRHCTLKNNVIRNTGAYAIEIIGDGNLITENEIHGTGGGGIITRSYGKERNTISYNHIYDCGKVFYSGAGINIDDGGGLISHNLIHDVSQSGIYTRHWSTGYGQERERGNQEQGLVIEYNEVYDVMLNMNDGGGIVIGGSNIHINNNLIHNVSSYEPDGSPGWGIYLGCETRDTKVENNILHNNRAGIHVWYSNRDILITNNIIVNGGKRGQIHYHNPRDRHHDNIRFIRNIVYYDLMDADLFMISGKESAPDESDYNIYWSPVGCIWLNPVIRGMKGIAYYEEWQNAGYDEHSLVIDPEFVNPRNGNYSLKNNSPAYNVEFKPIDMSTVGLRGRNDK